MSWRLLHPHVLFCNKNLIIIYYNSKMILPLSKVISRLEKMSTLTKLALIAVMSLIAVWLVCKKVSRPVVVPVAPVAEAFVPEVGCMKQDGLGVQYDSPPFYQMACHPETQFNLPQDARLRHRALYPAVVTGEVEECHQRHPMDTIYA